MNPPQVYSWKQLLGNPYRYGVSPKMLKDGGFTAWFNVKLIGEKRTTTPQNRLINFDRQYVYKAFGAVLDYQEFTTKEQFEELFNVIWEEHCRASIEDETI
jgi:hypothetical protein